MLFKIYKIRYEIWVVVVVVLVTQSFLDQGCLPGREVGLVMRIRAHVTLLPRFGNTRKVSRTLHG